MDLIDFWYKRNNNLIFLASGGTQGHRKCNEQSRYLPFSGMNWISFAMTLR
jgi:hypothetical protein